jgi:signal transduction histidine kinase
MNLLRGEYHDRIASLYPPAETRAIDRAVDQLLDGELALMLRHYQLDSEARLVARERAAESDRVSAIQTLSAGLAHEVRNPLNSAKLQLELLERRLRREAVDPRLIEPVQPMQHELERLTRLLGDFLAFARPVTLALAAIDVHAVVRGAVEAMRATAEARGARLDFTGEGALIAHADEAKLRQIVHNLMHNAIDASRPGGRVEITARGDADHLYLTVEDDGPGIPESIRHRIYDPFFTTKESGTGLGLSIVHSMVASHGGRIAVASSPQGTRFEVVLPRWIAVGLSDTPGKAPGA